MKKKITIIVIMLLVISSASVYGATNGFKDVKPGAWYYNYVTKASNNGYVDGYTDGTFRPNANVTRAQLAKIIVEYDNQVTNAIKDFSTDEQLVINAVANAIPSTVKVNAGEGYGSGFFVKSNLIMTNAHVIGNSTTVAITVSTGEKLNGTILAKDVAKDVALVKINKHFTPLNLTTSLKVGQNAIAIGNPLNMDQTVSKGIISKLDVKEFKSSTMFQMDTNINSGNSGGAVINSRGQVIGMTTGKLTGDVGQPAEGISFAIYASEIDSFIKLHVK